MKRNTPVIVLLLLYGWFPLMCAIVAICVQSLRITRMPKEFVALGKLMAVNSSNPNIDNNSQIPEAYYGTQIEILEGGELRRRALERLIAEHPELKQIDVEIRVTQTKGSGILNVAAMGAEPKFTRVFLDALLQEFIAFRREMSEKSIGSAESKVIDEVLSREKEVKKRAEELSAFQKQHDTLLMDMERERLAKQVSSLRGEVENLERTNQAGEKLKETREILAKTEQRFSELADEHTKLEQLKRDYENTRQDYDDWKKSLDRIQAAQNASPVEISILERPKVAVENEPDLVLSLEVAAAVGLIAGIVLQGIFIALFFKRNQPPPPLPPQ